MNSNKILKSIKNKIKTSLVMFSLFIVRIILIFKRQVVKNEKRLLIVKLDAIGDYILFRNFLEILKNSDKYKDYKITFCGNEKIKNLAEWLDGRYVDEFIWIDRKKIFNNPLYLRKIILKVCGRFLVAIQAAYSRESIGDILIKFSSADERIGFFGDISNISRQEKNRTDKWYTQLINMPENIIFEFYKNKYFFSQIINQNLIIKKPFINIKNLSIDDSVTLPDNFILLFPGAQQNFRKWSADNFKSIGDYLVDMFNCSIIICGSKSDTILAAEINKSNNGRIIDLTGKTNLTQLTKVISRAKLVISNDTSGAHIGAALDVPMIVLSQFNHYSRFVPYPKEINDKVHCLLPNIYGNISEEELVEKFKFGSSEDISLISVDEVKQAINKILL